MAIDPAKVDLPDAPVAFVDAPHHPLLQQLYAYWLSMRAGHSMPSRADIHPADIKHILPSVIIWNAASPYLVRLVGDHIVRFAGTNLTGLPAAHGKPPDAARALTTIFETVIATRSPRFRKGRAFWKPEKSYRDFESCFLPLSADGSNVDMILGGLKYDLENNSV